MNAIHAVTACEFYISLVILILIIMTLYCKKDPDIIPIAKTLI